jgi:cytosine/adenosine deaminase-related metal-dependent hydrolase
MRLLIEAANTSVAIEDGRIGEPGGRFDRVIRSPGEVRPGLINAHDHLHRNHYGRMGAPPYANAREWANDIQRRYADKIARGRAVPRRQALLAGAWKNLLSGVTHVAHHDPWEPDFNSDFPIKVMRIANAGSIIAAPDYSPPAEEPFALHVAEGVDERAALEVRMLDARGLLNSRLHAVHATGADADAIARLRRSECAIVWCPTSNRFLFGRTTPAELLADGMDVLLGSDSLLTGQGTLLDELHAAHGVISDARLLDAIGPLAARRLRFPPPSLEPGSPADLVLFQGVLFDATLQDLLIVMVDGEPRVLAPEFVASLGTCGGQTISWRSATRWISENGPVLL